MALSMLRSFRDKEFYHPFLIWLMVLCWYMFLGGDLLSTPQTKLANLIEAQSFWFFNDPPRHADDITIVAIDHASRKHLGLKWPWERSVTAALIRNIASFSPKVIGLDIVFSGSSQADEDRQLASALRSHPKVVLGYVREETFQDKSNEVFLKAASSMGFVDKPLEGNFISDFDTYFTDKDKNTEFSIEIALLKEYFDLDSGSIRIEENGVYLKDKLFIPSQKGRTRLNYLVYPTRFRIIPAYQIIHGMANPSDIKDKIVLVGATDMLIHDAYPTVLGTLPGVTILGNSLVMLLSKRFIHQLPAGTGLLLAFSLGFLIILVSKELSFVRALLLSSGFLFLTYLSFIFLRAGDIALPYFFILFSGATAYIAYNGYKHTNLLYVTNSLRRQAVVDPLTGVYSPRYFLLELDERLRARKPLTFIGIRIGNYERLSIDLGFDQLKHVVRNLTTLFSNEVKNSFSKTSVSRISADTFGINIEGEERDKTEAFFKHILEKVKHIDSELGNMKVGNALRTCLIYKSKGSVGAKKDLLCQMEELFKNGKEEKGLVEVLKQTGGKEKSTAYRMDMLDFITYDWEERNKELERSLRELIETNRDLDKLNWGTLTALARTIDAKSSWTAGHSERVTQLALKMGRVLGHNENELAALHRAALLHDIGKIATPQAILDKPGKLTDEEYRTVCKHPGIGARILEPIEAYREILPMVRQHHEWFNGKGYPDGIVGEALTQGGRILAVADVYDAVISDRPYRKGMLHDRAVGIIEKGSGTQFDPNVVEAFLKVMAQGKSQVLSKKPSNHLYAEGLVVSGTNKTGKGSRPDFSGA